MFPVKTIVLDSCTSTNDILKEEKDLYSSFTVLRCKRQTAGKGRWGRKWFSDNEKGLYFSILINDLSSKQIEYYPLSITCSLLEFFNAFEVFPKYQWPNDIYIENKKIAGILSESIRNEEKISMIIGVGVNINHNENDFPEELKDKAISLKILKKKNFIIDKIFIQLLKNIEQNIKETISFDKLMKKIEKKTNLKTGDKILIKKREIEYEGIFINYGTSGEIIVRTKIGIEKLFSGEVLKIEK